MAAECAEFGVWAPLPAAGCRGIECEGECVQAVRVKPCAALRAWAQYRGVALPELLELTVQPGATSDGVGAVALADLEEELPPGMVALDLQVRPAGWTDEDVRRAEAADAQEGPF